MIKILAVVVVFVLVAGFIMSTQKKEEIVENISPTITENDDSGEKLKAVEKNAQTNNEGTAIGTSKVLDLSNQGLKKTPSYVFDKTDIQELDLSNNELDGSLQAEVRHLQNLKVLDVSNNQFTGVPAEVGQLKNLEILDLSNNKLTGLPYELGNLTKLKLLNLKGNAYSTADLNTIKQNLPKSVVIEID